MKSHDKPTSIPYPYLTTCKPPSTAVVGVGRCRIESKASEEFESIVAQNVERASAEKLEKTSENKKLCKKLMKKCVAECYSWLKTIADVSVIDVEVCVQSKHVLGTEGFIIQCLLDAGADSVVLCNDNKDTTLMDALECARVPRERIVAHFDSPKVEEDSVKAASALAGAVSFSMSANEIEKLGSINIFNKLENTRIVALLSTSDYELGKLTEIVATLSNMDIGTTLVNPTPEQLGLSFAACAKTDRPDGLYTTVVCTRSGEALGLVYSSKESIAAALDCGRGVYYSRSRNGLWRKGDTSGHYQVLHRIDLDCDGDALRFTVTQKGDEPAFCHLNTLTCWGRPRGVRHLEETLAQRLKSAPEGSYTKRLFDDEDLLRNKLVEEAQELAEADNHQHVAEELADVLYFALVRAAKLGVSIDDAAAELDKKARKVTRRQGDSKAFRIAAGEAILKEK